MSDQIDKGRGLSAIPGLAALGLLMTGVAGIAHAFLGGDGLSLLASAVAFGIVFFVSFK